MQLSPECRDLLDQIFVVDEKKRISIQEMKQHAWYNKSLPPRLQHSEQHLMEEQQQLEAHIETRQLDQVCHLHSLTSKIGAPRVGEAQDGGQWA